MCIAEMDGWEDLPSLGSEVRGKRLYNTVDDSIKAARSLGLRCPKSWRHDAMSARFFGRIV
jgi:hypothetical protein